MTNSQTLREVTESGGGAERRSQMREPMLGTLWMIDHAGRTVLRCHCVDASPAGMRLRVPLGYGVAEGQRYELRSHLPGAQPAEVFGVVGCRWATVVRTQLRVEEDQHHVDVGVLLDATERSPLTLAATTGLA